MRKLVLVIAGLLALVACSSGQSSLAPDAFQELASTPGVVTLDVRTPAEYAGGHLAGARNIDVESADFATQLGQLDPKATYAVYCHSGNRSKVAMQKMTDAGFTSVKDLAGGIAAWQQAGLPVTTS